MDKDTDRIADILRSAGIIAVVGLSDKPDRSSHGVAGYLRAAGYRIIPVNPGIQEWNGLPAVASLTAIAEPVDIVNVFRRAEYTPDIVRDAVRIGARMVWLQQGIVSPEAERLANEAGLDFIQDRCIALEHSKRRSMWAAKDDRTGDDARG